MIAVIFGAYLWWVMGKASKQFSEATAVMLGADGQPESVTGIPVASVAGASPDATQTEPSVGPQITVWQTLAVYWRWEFVMILVLAGWAGLVVLQESIGFTDEKAQMVPMWLSIAFLLTLVAIVVNSVRQGKKERADIFDIAMRTGTDFKAVMNLLPIIGWIIGFVLLGGTIGFKYASVIYPLAFINANLDWQGKKRLWSLIPAGFAAFVSFVMLDGFLHVIWPQRFVLGWLGLD